MHHVSKRQARPQHRKRTQSYGPVTYAPASSLDEGTGPAISGKKAGMKHKDSMLEAMLKPSDEPDISKVYNRFLADKENNISSSSATDCKLVKHQARKKASEKTGGGSQLTICDTSAQTRSGAGGPSGNTTTSREVTSPLGFTTTTITAGMTDSATLH